MESLTINDLPQEVVERMRKAINDDPQMIALENKRIAFIKAKQYTKAVELKKKMNSIEERVINDYLRNYKGQAESMSNLMSGMNDQDREDINVCSNAIVLLCDMLETFSMDFNAILTKYHPDYRLEMYNKIIQLGKEAKGQVKFMSECTDDLYQYSFADSADDTTELIRNKVRSFIRKIRNKSINHDRQKESKKGAA